MENILSTFITVLLVGSYSLGSTINLDNSVQRIRKVATSTVVNLQPSSGLSNSLSASIINTQISPSQQNGISPTGSQNTNSILNANSNLAEIKIKSYKEWKNEKVQTAIRKVTITKAQMEYRRLNKEFLKKTEAGLGKDIDIERLESQLKNDMYLLEVAQQLSVTDYFAIYLTKQQNKNDAYKEAAQKMTPEEVKELINAFADSMFSSQSHKEADNFKSSTKMDPTSVAASSASGSTISSNGGNFNPNKSAENKKSPLKTTAASTIDDKVK